jgi:hypothetical protein
MFEHMREQGESGVGGEESLWRAVIATTIDEWMNGPLRQQREAEQYLFSDAHDFAFVCEQAGMDAVTLRARLRRLSMKGVAPPQLAMRVVPVA